MDYLKDLNNKKDIIDKDNCSKLMYSCGRDKSVCKPNIFANILGTTGFIAIFIFIVYRLLSSGTGSYHIIDFTKNLEISKMFIGLLLLTNIKNLSNSLIANIILPIIQPILPLLSCSMRLELGLFSIEVGNFVSDVLVFAINMYITYLIFILI